MFRPGFSHWDIMSFYQEESLVPLTDVVSSRVLFCHMSLILPKDKTKNWIFQINMQKSLFFSIIIFTFVPMDKTSRHLPSPEQERYGLEMKEIGYTKGYNQCTYDGRRRRSLKEKQRFERFGHFLDYLDEILWANRRK